MMSELSSSATMVIQNSLNIMPVMPPDRPMGRNTATVVRVEAVTEVTTSFVPLVQDSQRSYPSVR